jgi:hypothetical protein
MRFVVIRPIYGTDADGEDIVRRWVDVGPASSVEDAKRRYSPVQYGYAVVLRAA